jgi:hypothetical protein
LFTLLRAITLTKFKLNVHLLWFSNKRKIQFDWLVLLKESSKVKGEANKASLTDIPRGSQEEKRRIKLPGYFNICLNRLHNISSTQQDNGYFLK